MPASEKYALITGAGSGIGRYSALALLKDGWHVALCGRRVDALDETVALAGSDGARALAIPSDVSTPDGVAKLFQAYRAQWSSTKHAITGLTKSTALDGRAHDIVACQIDIGNAETPMTQRMKKGVLQPSGASMIEPVMDVQNVADTILLMANMSLDANIQTVTVMASKMPFVGRG